MKRRSIAIMQMHIECSKCLRDNASRYAGYSPLETAALELQGRIEQAEQKKQQADEIIKAYTIDKKAKLEELANSATALRKKVQAVMLSKNDILNFEKVYIARTTITKAAALTALSYARTIYDMAGTLTPEERATFQITDDELEVMQSLISKFADANASRRDAQVLRQLAGNEVEDIIRNTSKFIRTTINLLMGNYEFSDTAFFDNWILAQRIINPSQHHAQITGTVIDEESLQPLQRVKVTAVSGTRIFEDMTDSEGKYKVPVNPEVWSLSFELPSYVKEDKPNIVVDSGEREILNVKLRPAE